MNRTPPGFDARGLPAGRRGSHAGATVLGSFHLLREIGCGSFAVAYLARQLGTERHAVVKIPHRHLMEETDRGERIRSRFAAELRASTRVSHHNIAVVYTAGDIEDGLPAIAMEYVPGRMLARELASEAPLSPEEAGRLGCQIASALGAVHSAGIIHRDVSPRNIIAGTDSDRNARYVLLDFGIAKLDGLGNRTLGAVGTPRYMAPEQMHGRAVPRSDMFALGAVLWWALTGKEHLAGIDGVGGLLAWHLDRPEAPDPRQVRPSIPAPVARLMSRLLHPDPEQRPSARAFAAAWARLMRDWSESPRVGQGAGGDAGEDAGDTEIDARAVPAHADSTSAGAGDSAPVLPQTLDSTGESQDGDVLAGSGARTEEHGAGPGAPSGGIGAARARSRPQLTTTLERFLGLMPEWLQDLQEATHHGDALAIVRVCTRIGDSARLMSADQLARLSEILAGLAGDGILDQAVGFVREIEAEFQRWFRELLDSRQSSL